MSIEFIRDVVAQGLVKLDKVSTEKNLSDILTKPQSLIKFKYCLDLVKVSHS